MTQKKQVREGFGCPAAQERLQKFLVVLLVVAVVAYLMSSKSKKMVQIDVPQTGGLSIGRISSEVGRIIGTRL